jgi:hypothetical protein
MQNMPHIPLGVLRPIRPAKQSVCPAGTALISQFHFQTIDDDGRAFVNPCYSPCRFLTGTGRNRSQEAVLAS